MESEMNIFLSVPNSPKDHTSEFAVKEVEIEKHLKELDINLDMND